MVRKIHADRCFMQLEIVDREILLLSYAGYNFTEIGRAIGFTPKTVSKHFYFATYVLRIMIEGR